MNGRHQVIAVVIGAASLFGCDESFSPFTDGVEPPFFVVNGFLDSNADTQFVRVDPVRTVVEMGLVFEETLFVTSQDLTTGDETTWIDSTVTVDGEKTARLFYSTFHPLAGRRYRIEVRNNQDRTDARETAVPSAPSINLRTPMFTGFEILQTTILNDIDDEPLALSTTYQVNNPESATDTTITFDYRGRGRRTTTGWEVTMPLISEARFIRSAVDNPDNDPKLEFIALSVDVDLLSSEWAEEALEPGFFGAVGRHSIPIDLGAGVIDSLGFAIPN